MSVVDTAPLSSRSGGLSSSAPSRGESPARSMADPTPIAFGIFGFALFLYGVRFADVSAATLTGATTYAATYGILIAGLTQASIGLFAIVRGMFYPGTILGLFGMWLVGLFLLLTHVDTSPMTKAPAGDRQAEALAKATVAAWHAGSVGWYVLALLVPLVLLAVPAIVQRSWLLVAAFAALIALVALLGLAFHGIYAILTDTTSGGSGDLSGPVALLQISGYVAFAAAAVIWVVMAKEVYEITGVLKRGGGAAR